MAKILLLNGPNLNLLGTREPGIYGAGTLADITARLQTLASELGHELEAFQSNAEAELINRIQGAPSAGIAYILFNPADFSGAGAAYGAVAQIGPMVTVLVVAGAGATAMCADLGARTIREEIDAMRVMGINPLQALVVPRVLAATFVAVMLSAVVILVSLVGSFVFTVFIQHVTPGAFAAGVTVLTGVGDLAVGLIKAALFGLSAGLIACYKGLFVGGGPAGVGYAVNETVVYTFMALFAINIIASAVGVEVLR